MKALRSPIGSIPRAFVDSRRVTAKKYREYCLTIQAQWGPLPPVALPTLKEAGRAAIELERLSLELEAAHMRKRRRDVTRIRKHQFMLREQLARLERRLEEFGTHHTRSPLAAVQQAVAAANRR